MKRLNLKLLIQVLLIVIVAWLLLEPSPPHSSQNTILIRTPHNQILLSITFTPSNNYCILTPQVSSLSTLFAREVNLTLTVGAYHTSCVLYRSTVATQQGETESSFFLVTPCKIPLSGNSSVDYQIFADGTLVAKGKFVPICNKNSKKPR